MNVVSKQTDRSFNTRFNLANRLKNLYFYKIISKHLPTTTKPLMEGKKPLQQRIPQVLNHTVKTPVAITNDAINRDRERKKQELKELVDSVQMSTNPASARDMVSSIFRDKYNRKALKVQSEDEISDVDEGEEVREEDEGELVVTTRGGTEFERDESEEDEEDGEEEDEEEGEFQEEEVDINPLSNGLSNGDNNGHAAPKKMVKKRKKMDASHPSYFIDDEAGEGAGSDEEEKDQSKLRKYVLTKKERLYSSFKNYFKYTVMSVLIPDWWKLVEENVKKNIPLAVEQLNGVNEIRKVCGNSITQLVAFINKTKRSEATLKLYNLLCSTYGYKEFDSVSARQLKGVTATCAIDSTIGGKGSMWTFKFSQRGGKSNNFIFGKVYSELICAWVTIAKNDAMIKSETADYFSDYLKDRSSVDDDALFQSVQVFASDERIEKEFFNLRNALVCFSQFMSIRGGIVQLTSLAEVADKDWFATSALDAKPPTKKKAAKPKPNKNVSLQLV